MPFLTQWFATILNATEINKIGQNNSFISYSGAPAHATDCVYSSYKYKAGAIQLFIATVWLKKFAVYVKALHFGLSLIIAS